MHILPRISIVCQPFLKMLTSNGAGKTTTMQSIIGLIPSSHGNVIFDGQDITKTPCHKIVHAGLTQVPEGRRIFQELTVYENLLMGGFSQKDQSLLKKDIEATYERFPRLAERKNQIAGTLSGGEQQIVVRRTVNGIVSNLSGSGV